MLLKRTVQASAIVFALLSPAFAADFSTVLTDGDGKPMRDDFVATLKEEDRPVLTLGLACYHALLMSYPDETALSGEDKVKRAALAMKVREAKNMDLPVEDVALTKKMINRLYNPLVVYRAWPLLDPAALK